MTHALSVAPSMREQSREKELEALRATKRRLQEKADERERLEEERQHRNGAIFRKVQDAGAVFFLSYLCFFII